MCWNSIPKPKLVSTDLTTPWTRILRCESSKTRVIFGIQGDPRQQFDETAVAAEVGELAAHRELCALNVEVRVAADRIAWEAAALVLPLFRPPPLFDQPAEAVIELAEATLELLHFRRRHHILVGTGSGEAQVEDGFLRLQVHQSGLSGQRAASHPHHAVLGLFAVVLEYGRLAGAIQHLHPLQAHSGLAHVHHRGGLRKRLSQAVRAVDLHRQLFLEALLATTSHGFLRPSFLLRRMPFIQYPESRLDWLEYLTRCVREVPRRELLP